VLYVVRQDDEIFLQKKFVKEKDKKRFKKEKNKDLLFVVNENLSEQHRLRLR
jgi:hypothetical protein